MSKPDWCPQDVWDKADELDGQTISLAPDATHRIARAILAAKAEEREACAELAEDYKPDMKPWESPTERANAKMATDWACIDLAAAIRKRGS